MHPRDLQIKNFTYDLPEDRIAKYPLPERDLSKLLIYKESRISENIYRNIDQYLPENSLLIFNNTKVIPARLFFHNAQGIKVEIFCLDPVDEYLASAMSKTGSARWNCMIGRANKWKEKTLEKKTDDFILTAEIVDRTSDAFVVEFKWQPEQLSFAQVLDEAGMMPIPPYLRRESEDIDQSRYQTVYAKHEGSVAAPTAGLHFTEQVFEKLRAKNIQTDYVTLHVGAGTFKPVKSEKMEGHEMHAEWMEVKIETIQHLMEAISAKERRPIIAIGTTALRTLESLYWMGLKADLKPEIPIDELEIGQWEVYELTHSISASKALQSLLNWLEKNKLNRLLCKTQIMIAPGYDLKVADALVTNFHQPGSTLLLLVAAIVGEDWRKIYDYAMANDFRFLSYGDGSLIWR